MANNLTNYLENKLVDHLLGTTTYTKPTSVYVALYTASPTESTPGTEVAVAGYARQIATFSAASNGSATNSTAINFSIGANCTVVAIGILDALTSGNLLIYGNLSSNINAVTNDTIQISIGSLTISLD